MRVVGPSAPLQLLWPFSHLSPQASYTCKKQYGSLGVPTPFASVPADIIGKWCSLFSQIWNKSLLHEMLSLCYVFQPLLHFIKAQSHLFSVWDALQTKAFVYPGDLCASEISFHFLQTLRSFSPLLCHFILTRSPKDKAGLEVTSSCVHWGHVLFQGQSRLLLFVLLFSCKLQPRKWMFPSVK